MKQKLEDYTAGKIHFTPIIFMMMNNRSKDWYAELGKYITNTLDIEKITELEFLSKKLKEKKKIVTKIKDFMSDDNNLYFSVANHFLTSVLNEVTLRKMFGEPILHNEFGEGFDGEWNEELDDYDDPEIKESYASYFVNIGGTNFHIGYDHRGTGIEIELPSSYKWSDKGTSDSDAEKCFDALKGLIDLYKTKC
jgi:hypothetical protein